MISAVFRFIPSVIPVVSCWYFRPTSFTDCLKVVGGSVIASCAFAAARGFVSSVTERVTRSFQAYQLKLLLQGENFTRMNVNRGQISKIEREAFQEFLLGMFTTSLPSLPPRDVMLRETGHLIDSFINKNNGLCLAITHQFKTFRANKRELLGAKDLMHNFLSEKRREGALLLQFCYHLSYNGLRALEDYLPSTSFIRKAADKEYKSADTLLKTSSSLHFESYFPDQRKPQEELCLAYLSYSFLKEVIGLAKGAPAILNFYFKCGQPNFNEAGHSVYFSFDTKKSSYLFFDANDLCISINDEKKFLQIVYLYLNLMYPNLRAKVLEI